ncbi:A disintegrin and metalloproteinase with thrombospondin motifs 7-like [Neodiprion lecontei]|uniref:A disintegrin and metalloproteinase with thrombospondin motifs 7-like n=1 Tax=Neodiprion lecontei TaxID=441921 RepID=A0ABM3FV93_NEOLC|nr:A disintegrin and metalloproteinase with thrombospondin motifs 7-like [Neodiprion lecontei]
MVDRNSPEATEGPYHDYQGRYTRDVHNAEMLIPRRVTEDGSFLTFNLPNFYDRQELEARKKRAADPDAAADDLSDHKLHLVLPFNGADHHVELTPHHEFMSPELVMETRGEGARTNLDNGVRFRRADDMQCHYRGHVRGHRDSRAALSLCDGVAGYLHTDQGRYFIEPVSQAVPDREGQHVHMVYQRKAPHETLHQTERSKRNCGTSDDWETAWAEQLEKKNRRDRLAGNGTFEKRTPSAATHSIHRYVELTIVCDERFLKYHKSIDYEQYVLTILNMVSDYYHDSSSGNQLDVVVVRIIYLEKEKEEIDLSISPEAEKTLDSFATWVNKMNPKDTKHPNHHDIGVLITRYDICASDEAACNLLGLAYVSAACDPPKAACINEDAGLILGITVTHEVGHNLGCSHDTVEISGCPPQDTSDKSYFIMSPIVDVFTLRWSPCSRKFLTTFVETLGDCLLDNHKKPNAKYKLPGMLPGAMYDGDFQCRLMLEDPEASVCERTESICESLWCKKNSNAKSCSSKGAPAEGTKCGENKWCIHKKCVEIGKRPSAVHGGWGKWSKTSDCSRTCGGGVKYSERDCDNPTPKDGGRYCLGERKRFSTCNTQPCDPKKPSFRAAQCTEFNTQKVMPDGLHTWIPHPGPPEAPCALYCLNEKKTYVKLAPMVKDGTPCEPGTKNLCIGGSCAKVGCDWEIYGDALEDQCGICKGDGTQCTPVEGDYTATGKGDYQKVVTVPKGSRNIRFFEKAPADNSLAIKLEKGNTYILNGDHRENRNGEYPCAGDIAVYKHPEPKKEEVLIKGPINDDIQLQYVFYNPKVNPGVHYVYYVLNGKSGGKPQYQWDFLDWEPCSAKCGGGTQLAQASCIEQQSGRVSNSFCKDIKRPEPKSRTCNTQSCKAKWRVSQWSRCSACGGKKGQQRRKVQCVKPAAHPGGEDVQAELTACKGQVPKQSQSCTGNRTCKKTCKKTRSNVFEEGDATTGKPQSLEEQRNAIDKLVDMGMSRYLEKTNGERYRGKSEKRNVAADFKHLIDDWVAPSSDAGIDAGNNCPGKGSAQAILATPKPGSIVKDNIPSSNIVVLEAPIINNQQSSNMSDQAFQEEGDEVGSEIDTSHETVFKGSEAAKRLQSPEHHDGAESMGSATNLPSGG